MNHVKKSGEVQLSFSWLLLESGSRKGNQRSFCKIFNIVLPGYQESLGADCEEKHLYSPVMMGGAIQSTFNRQLLLR